MTFAEAGLPWQASSDPVVKQVHDRGFDAGAKKLTESLQDIQASRSVHSAGADIVLDEMGFMRLAPRGWTRAR